MIAAYLGAKAGVGGAAVLAIDNLTSRYGRIEVLHGVSLEVKQGEIVDAGRLQRRRQDHAAARDLRACSRSRSGTIRLDGEAINAMSAHARVARGIAQVPEGRQVFAPLAVDDNLRLGAYRRRDAEIAADLDKVYATFPALAEKRAFAPARCRAASSRCSRSAAR